MKPRRILPQEPNEGVSQLDVENIGRRPYIRRRADITITYDTPPEKVKRAVEILKEILSAPEPPEDHPNAAINQPGYPPAGVLQPSEFGLLEYVHFLLAPST